MTVLNHGQDWELGGPTVFHSPWWLREHWGRAFELITLNEGNAPREHGLVVLRRRPGTIAAAELERVDPDEERELAALRHQVALLALESAGLRAERDGLVSADARRLSRRVSGRVGQMRRRP